MTKKASGEGSHKGHHRYLDRMRISIGRRTA
ncbi:MAG: hypothetical protein WA820_27330 [Bradyrhizobium sp.]